MLFSHVGFVLPLTKTWRKWSEMAPISFPTVGVHQAAVPLVGTSGKEFLKTIQINPEPLIFRSFPNGTLPPVTTKTLTQNIISAPMNIVANPRSLGIKYHFSQRSTFLHSRSDFMKYSKGRICFSTQIYVIMTQLILLSRKYLQLLPGLG